jgi:hypothetical protein
MVLATSMAVTVGAASEGLAWRARFLLVELETAMVLHAQESVVELLGVKAAHAESVRQHQLRTG